MLVNLKAKSARGLLCAFLAMAFCLSPAAVSRADGWSFWGRLNLEHQVSGNVAAGLATDGTNLFYSTLLEGVWRASLEDRQFTRMPMTGFPAWDANTNTNGFAVWNIAVSAQGTLVISGSPVNVTSNTVSPPPSSFNNTLPVFYWWDEDNQTWQASSVTNKSYPYTANVGNFSTAQDGSLWTCSGFAPYAYRSTDGGRSYTAFDINARVPTNYFPLPLTANQFSFGKLFSVVAGWGNEIVIGTETGGYLCSTNNGLNWASLDPNYTNAASTNPLGRIGNALVTGLDHYGNFLCANFESDNYPGRTNWDGVTLIGWHPSDGSYFNAANGFATGFGPARVLTPPSGTSFCFMNQNYLLQGGVFRAADGRHWTQFNQNNGLDVPFGGNITNAVIAGNCFTTLSNLVFISVAGTIYVYDSTSPPVVNRPPVALPQNINLWENTATNVTLSGNDADGDSLNFTVTIPPQHGTLDGAPPDMTYTSDSNFIGLDSFSFIADDGVSTSAPVVVNLAINALTNTLSTVALTNPERGEMLVTPTNLTFAADAVDPDGIRAVNFYVGNTFVGQATNPPYTMVLTNVSPGDYAVSARAIDNHGARTWSAPVGVLVLPTAPVLKIQRVDSENVSVTWPLELDGFFVESAPDAIGPWMLSPFAPEFFPNGQTVIAPMADRQFFRLTRPGR